MPDHEQRFEDARDLGAFCPAALDDWPLSFAQFRVYMHVCRRAGGGSGCWATQSSMAEHLRVSRRTVLDTLASLVELGFLSVERRAGNRRAYRILPIPPRPDLPNTNPEVLELEKGVVKNLHNSVEDEGGVVCENSQQLYLGLHSHLKVLPLKVVSSTHTTGACGREGRWWDGDPDPMVAYVAEAFAQVPKYAEASRPPTPDRVRTLVARIREDAPDEGAIRDMVDNWRDFHAADTKARYGKQDPVASLREQIAIRRPKWVVAKKRAEAWAGTTPKRKETMRETYERLMRGAPKFDPEPLP